MADIAQNLRELKEITALLAQNAIGQSARATHPAALSRLAPPDDYVPPLSTAEVYQAELTRHKNQLAQQRVQFSPPAHDAAKPAAQEPQRSTNITMASVTRTIPNSALTYVNTNSFNIENMNAENNLKSFMRQMPGKIIHMVRTGTYDDAVRNDHSYSDRFDHIVALSQRDVVDWNTGDVPWTRNGVTHKVTRTFLDKLDERFQDQNGMRGGPWDSIHPRAATYPVSPVLPEYIDLGCYDRNGPVVISQSKQDVLHNDNLEQYIRAIENLAAPNTLPTKCIYHHEVIAALMTENMPDLPVPYFKVGTTVKSLHDLIGRTPSQSLLAKASNDPTVEALYDLLPI